MLPLCAVLTALTCLQLDHLGAAVDDAAAAALASSLTGLRHLELQGSNIEQQATVAALQRLPMLTHLQLCTEEEEAAGARGDAGEHAACSTCACWPVLAWLGLLEVRGLPG